MNMQLLSEPKIYQILLLYLFIEMILKIVEQRYFKVFCKSWEHISEKNL